MKSIVAVTVVILIAVALGSPRKARATISPPFFETEFGCLDPNVRKPQTISLGRIDSRVIDIPKPVYPLEAKDAKISGVVTALVVVDETGQVIWARVRNGHPLLQAAVKTVVCRARVRSGANHVTTVNVHYLRRHPTTSWIEAAGCEQSAKR